MANEKVAWRHVAMYEIGGMDGRERVRQRLGQDQQVITTDASALVPEVVDPRLEIAPVGQLEHHVRLTGVGLAEIEDRCHPVRVDASQMLSLGDEAFAIIGNEAVVLRQHFQRHLAAEALVNSPIHRCESA